MKSNIDSEYVFQELLKEEANVAAAEAEVRRLQERCERRRKIIAAYKHLVEVLEANPIEENSPTVALE